MARQEATSIFSDGLMSDLHPINTPKSVLTDCLNGTYITYNGNEFILQNDMGNYKLKNCRLPVNFIPVGVKGYADILYIVSYNPITKMVEIGSYPAPQSIFTTGDSPNLEADETDLAPFIIEGEVVYSEIIDKYKKPIFIFTGTDEETYKLYPGDEFKFSGELPTLNFTYQHLNFYILDEDNKLYDIDDSLLYQRTFDNSFQLTSQEMRKVFWETPGWLAAQYNLYVPDKFNLGLRSLNVPEFFPNNSNVITETNSLDDEEPTTGFKVSMDLTTQTIISDRLFQSELLKHGWTKNNLPHNELLVRYIIDQSSNDYGTFKGIVSSGKDYTTINLVEQQAIIDIPCYKHNYQDDIITAYTNDRAIWFMPALQESQSIANYPGKIFIKAYPILTQGNSTVEFTQFASEFSYTLNNLKDKNEIQIAQSIYKWAVDNDSITVSFDIDGPFINASDIRGTYSFRRLLSNGNEDQEDIITNADIPNLTLFGQNTLNIPMEGDNGQNYIKEGGVYILEIKLDQGLENLNTTKMIIIASEVFNEFFGTHDSYSTITPTEWISKWWDYFSVSNVNINSLKYDFSSLSNTINYRWSDETEFTKYKLGSKSFSDFLNDVYTEKMPDNYQSEEWVSSDTANFPTLEIVFEPENSEDDTDKDYSVDFNVLGGNLWSPKYSITVKLNQNGGDTLLEFTKTNDDGNWNDILTVPGLSNKITAITQNVSVANYTESFPYVTFINNNGSSLNAQKNATNGRWLLHSYMLKRGGGNRNVQVIIADRYLDSTKNYSGEIESTRTKTSGGETITLTSQKNNFIKNFKQGFKTIPLAVVQLSTINVNNDSRIGWYAAEGVIKSPSFLIDDLRGETNTSYNGYSGLIMQNHNKEPIYIDFGASQRGNAHESIQNALYQLSRYSVRSYDGTSKTEYVPRLGIETTDTSFQTTLTRYNVEIILNDLCYSDHSWLTSTFNVSKSYIGHTLINSSATIETRKTIDNVTLSNSYTLDVDFSQSGIDTYVQNISTFITDNENDIKELQNTGSDTSELLHYYGDNTAYNNRLKQLGLTNSWNIPQDNFREDVPLKKSDVVKFFGCTTSQFTISNLIFDTSTNLKLITGGRGNDKTDGHGQIETAWYEKLTLNTNN